VKFLQRKKKGFWEGRKGGGAKGCSQFRLVLGGAKSPKRAKRDLHYTRWKVWGVGCFGGEGETTKRVSIERVILQDPYSEREEIWGFAEDRCFRDVPKGWVPHRRAGRIENPEKELRFVIPSPLLKARLSDRLQKKKKARIGPLRRHPRRLPGDLVKKKLEMRTTGQKWRKGRS